MPNLSKQQQITYTTILNAPIDHSALVEKWHFEQTNRQTNGRTDATKHIISPASRSINILRRTLKNVVNGRSMGMGSGGVRTDLWAAKVTCNCVGCNLQIDMQTYTVPKKSPGMAECFVEWK